MQLPLPSGRINSAILLIFLIFLGLKITGEVSWSWWLVLSPLIVACVLGLLRDD